MSCILYILTFYQPPMEDVFSCPLVYLSGWNIIFSEMALCKLHSTPPFYWLYFQKRLMHLSASGDEKWLQSCAFVCWQLSGCTIVDSIDQSRNNQTLPTFFWSQRQAEPSSCLPACHLPCILILNNSCMYSRCMYSCLPVCLVIVHAPYSAFSLTSNEGTPPNTLACYNASSYVYFKKNINL